jgi:hypothetical protein
VRAFSAVIIGAKVAASPSSSLSWITLGNTGALAIASKNAGITVSM